MKTKSEISGYILRSSAAALLFSCMIVALSSAINVPNHPAKFAAPQNNTAFGLNGHESAVPVAASVIRTDRTLTFADRVAYQRAIEEIYWRHRIWPKERADSKPSLDAVISQAQLENKVETYLRTSRVLADYWQQSITPEQLQAEMDRMATHTRRPEVLRELFEALGNDPFVIAECLARPTLAERSLMNRRSYDQRIPGELTPRAEADLLADPMVVAQEEEPLESLPAEVENEPLSAIAAPSDEYILPDVPDVGACTGDTWTATSTTNAPSGRELHTAVWTGSEMIIWGGVYIDGNTDYHYLNTGGRYNPTTDSWTATSMTNAPTGRYLHTAVWTGSEMIVWGGFNDSSLYLNTGGRYDPSTDSWTATSTTNAPSARWYHTAVWTGREMIVWGGSDTREANTGGRYNPSTDSWTATSTTNAPAPREWHTARWTGSEMIVWGGGTYYMLFKTGGRYNPNTDSWTATSTTSAPSARLYHTVVWTGNEMIVWGGFDGIDNDLNTGGKYNPGTNTWAPTSTINAPAARSFHTAVWTGGEMIIWGGYTNTGGRYDPVTNSWTATSTTNAPAARDSATARWTGSEMIVWGGYDAINYLNTGGKYCGLGPPLVTTNRATNVASFSATLNGSLNPHGLATTVYFQYGTTTSYGHTTSSQAKTGTMYQSIRANISGLAASTTYHFRIVATNSAGTTYGGDRTFTTLRATGSPVVTTNPATLVASFSSTLNGTVDPHGLTTTVYFQYGTTTNYGLTTTPQSKSGNTYQSVAAKINGLTASRTYHLRIVATNSSGTRYGSDRTFTTLSATGPPVVITNPATNVASSSATLNGSVDPHGLSTNVHFQYGTTTSYGHTTANQSKTGNTYQNVAANISGLTSHTTYHFRVVATNSGGTRYGSDRTFTTP